VQERQIEDDAISRPKLKDAVIDNVKMDDDSVSNRNMQDNSVANNNMQDDSVSTPNIQDDSVTNQKLDADSVDTKQLVDDSVTNPKIADDAVQNRNIDTDAVQENQIQNDAVKNRHIDSNAVDTEQIANGAVKTNQIDGRAVTESKLAQDSVGSFQIEANAVDSNEIANGGVHEQNLRNGAVTTNKIRNSAVTAAKIAANAVGSSEIATGAVGSSEIASGAVTNAKISGMDGRKLENDSVFSTRIPAPSQDAIVANGLVVGFGLSKRGNRINVNQSEIGGGSHRHNYYDFYREFSPTGSGSLTFSERSTFFASSSVRYKKDISNLEISDIKKLLTLEPKKYKYKNSKRSTQDSVNKDFMYGYLAEDLMELGFTEPIGFNENGEPDSINYGLMSMLVLELVKNQQTEINELKDKVDKLEGNK
jgi:hypothetical protein